MSCCVVVLLCCFVLCCVVLCCVELWMVMSRKHPFVSRAEGGYHGCNPHRVPHGGILMDDATKLQLLSLTDKAGKDQEELHWLSEFRSLGGY